MTILLLPFKDSRGRILPGPATTPAWAQLVAQSAISFSAGSVAPEGEWFERLASAPARGQSCLVRVYPPFDLRAAAEPFWTLYLPPQADLNGPLEAAPELTNICLLRLSVNEVLRESAGEAWLVGETLEKIALQELPGRFAPATATPPLGARALSHRQIRQVREDSIICVDINMEGDVGETLICLEQAGRRHLVLHRVWSFSEVDMVYAGNRILSEAEWDGLNVGLSTDGSR